MSQGVYVLGGKCPGVSVQGVSVRGVYVLGVSVRGVHVVGGYVLEPYHTYVKTGGQPNPFNHYQVLSSL